MKSRDDESYEQYYINRRRYEREQRILPFAIIFGAVIISWLSKLVITVIAVIGAVTLIVYLCLKRRLFCEKSVTLSKQEAKEGAELRVTVVYESMISKVNAVISPNTKDGQMIVIKNVVFVKSNGKKIKKSLRLKIRVV